MHGLVHSQLASIKPRDSGLQEGNHPAVVLHHPLMMSYNISGRAECVPSLGRLLSAQDQSLYCLCRRKERRPCRLSLSPSRHCHLRLRRHRSSLPRQKASRLWSCPCLSLSSFSRPSQALRASPTASLPPPPPETSQPARCRTTRCPCS